MAHGDDVRVAGHYAHGVGYGFALGCGGGLGLGEAQHVAAQLVHGRLKAQAGAGGGLEEQRGQLLAVAGLGVLLGVCDDVHRAVDELLNFLGGQLHDVDQMSHALPPVIQLSSLGLLRNAISRATSSLRM